MSKNTYTMAIDYAIIGARQFADKRTILGKQPDERTMLLMAAAHEEPKCSGEHQKTKGLGTRKKNRTVL